MLGTLLVLGFTFALNVGVFVGSRWLVAKLSGVHGLSLLAFESGPWEDTGVARRLLFTAVGPLACYFAAAAFFGLGQHVGGQQEATLRVNVLPDGAAARAGILEDDEVVALNETRIQDWAQLVEEVQSHPNEEVTLVVNRDGHELSFQVSLADPPVLKVTPKMRRRAMSAGKILRTSLVFPLVFWKAKVMTWIDPEALSRPMRIEDPGEAPAGAYLFYASVLGSWGLPIPLLVAFASFPRRTNKEAQKTL